MNVSEATTVEPPPLAGDRRPEPEEAHDGAAEVTELLDDMSFDAVPPFPHPLRHPLRTIGWLVQMTFGIVSLILLLAVVAAIPIVNFLALGYLLEVEGRVARTGRLRSAFPLLAQAPRLGAIALGVWIWLLPLRLLAGYTADARLIDPASSVTVALQWVLIVSAVLIGVHLCLALARGGSLGCFLRPIKNSRWIVQQVRRGGYFERAGRNIRGFVASLRIGHHFWLGLRGFLGAAAWLVIPSAMLVSNVRTEPIPILMSLAGGLLLMLVISWVPFLQARLAAQNSLRAAFDLSAVRKLFRRAPIAWLVALIIVCVLSLPLYLSKVVLPPRDALFLLTPLFIATIYPARVVTGWAYHRAASREQPAWRGIRWAARLLLVPLLAAYVGMLFFTPYISEHGRRVLFEHHAFLLPWAL